MRLRAGFKIPREPRCERQAAGSKERRRWRTLWSTSRRSGAGGGGLPPQPEGLGGFASPRGVARHRRSAPSATPPPRALRGWQLRPARPRGILKPALGPTILLLAFSLSGCAPVLLATAGVVVGYAVSRDSVTIDLDRTWDKVWAASLEETKHQGLLKREDRGRGRLDARIRETDVSVTLEQLTPSTVRLVIRARKHLLPQVEVAQRLGVAIARRAG